MSNCIEAQEFFAKTKNLPLLPAEIIQDTYEKMWMDICSLNKDVETKKDGPVRKLHAALERYNNYVRNFWLKTVGVDKICVYEMPHRSNGAIERYHRTWKELIGTHPQMINFLSEYIK